MRYDLFMTNEKPLTKSELLAALKEAGVATQDDLQRLGARLDNGIRAVDSRLNNVQKNMVTQAQFKKRLDSVEAKMVKMERSLKRRMGKHKTEIMTAVSKLATSTPTQEDFDDLQARVDKYHPLS
jgi:hypothetical protein